MSLTNATFTDANPGDHTADFTATIDWGDGTAPTTGTVSYNSVTKVYTVAGSHTYAEEGTYTPTVTVKDNVDVGGTSSTTITGTATITDAPLTGSSGASERQRGRVGVADQRHLYRCQSGRPHGRLHGD